MFLKKEFMFKIMMVSIVAMFIFSCGSGLSPKAKRELRIANNKLKIAKKYELALEHFQNVLKEYPNHLESLKNSGDIYFFLAEQNADKAVEYYKKSYIQYDKFINLTEQKERLREEEKEWKEDANKKKKSSWVRIYKKAKEKYDNKKYDEAIAIYEELLDIDPSNVSALTMMANSYIKKGDQANAIETFKKILQAEPENKSALTQVAYHELQEGNTENALRHFKKLRKLEPKNVDYLYNIALIYNRMEEHEKAKELYKKIIEIQPNAEDAYKQLAYYARNDKEKAIEIYKKLIEINPENKDYYQNLTIYYNKMKDYDKVITYGEKWLDLEYSRINKLDIIKILRFAAMKLGRDDLVKKYQQMESELE